MDFSYSGYLMATRYNTAKRVGGYEAWLVGMVENLYEENRKLKYPAIDEKLEAELNALPIHPLLVEDR